MALALRSKTLEFDELTLEFERVSAYADNLRSVSSTQKIPDEFMEQSHPIDNLLRKIRDLEANIDESNKTKMNKDDKEAQADFTPTTASAEAQTDIPMSYFDQRPKSRSSSIPSKPTTPKHRRSSGSQPQVRGQILLDDSTLAAMDSAHRGKDSSKSSKSKATGGLRGSPKSDISRASRVYDPVSKQSERSKREVEDPTPIIMKSVYKHDSPHSSLRDRSVSGISAEEVVSQVSHTSQLAQATPRDAQAGKPTHNRLPSIHQQPRGPPPDIKSYIRQAASRHKDDFDDLP